MRPKTVALMLVAIGCGLVAAMLTIQLQPGPSPQQQPVLVAAMTLPAGTLLKEPEKQLVLKMYAPDTVPPGAVANIEDLRNKILARTIDANTAVTLKDIGTQDLFKPAPKGTRAVTIRANIETAHAGFTLPGSHVDLICTGREVNGARIGTLTFLEDVLVLAVNTQRDRPGQDTGGVVANPHTITLALTPDDVQKVFWATNQGGISIALRKPGDDDIVKPRPRFNVMDEPATGPDQRSDDLAMVKVWVAKDNIRPGQTVDKPDDFFELMRFPKIVAGDAFGEHQKDELKGHLQHLVVKGFPVTRQHYRVTESNPRPAQDRGVITVLRVFEGETLKHKFFFDNGKSVDPDIGTAHDRALAPGKDK